MFRIFSPATFLLCFLSSFFVFAQRTVTLQPDALNGKDAPVYSCIPCSFSSSNYGNQPSFNAIAWTNNGNISNSRSLVQFDLSRIPANANILNAQLSLFANPAGTHSTTSGPNNTVLQRITSTWN